MAASASTAASSPTVGWPPPSGTRPSTYPSASRRSTISTTASWPPPRLRIATAAPTIGGTRRPRRATSEQRALVLAVAGELERLLGPPFAGARAAVAGAIGLAGALEPQVGVAQWIVGIGGGRDAEGASFG